MEGNGSRTYTEKWWKTGCIWSARRMPTVSSALVAAPEVQARDRIGRYRLSSSFDDITRRSGPWGAVSKETATNLSRPTTSSTLTPSFSFSSSFFFPFSQPTAYFRCIRVVADRDYYGWTNVLSLDTFSENKVYVVQYYVGWHRRRFDFRKVDKIDRDR